MRRGLQPSDLGDLFDQPLTAVLSIARPDGSIFSRPVWHRFVEGHFEFEFPGGDRKIAMLERDPRATVLLAEDAFPYRAVEVRGRIRMRGEDYHAIGTEICRRYVEAYDPNTPIDAYLNDPGGMIGILDAEVMTCWDYADDFMMPPTHD
jgi:hypothetical protein